MKAKSIVILGDGMSDHPVARLDGKTPLMVARKPHIDRVAREGRVGLFRTIPEGLPNGSDVANLSVLGYDPRTCYQGRAVLEAANMGVELAPDDVAFRCNLICIEGSRIKNHSAGHISSEEAAELIRDLDRELGGGTGDMPVTFHPGVSYRHIAVLRGDWGSPEVECAPPHDHVGEKASDLMPRARRGTVVGSSAADATAAASSKRSAGITAGYLVSLHEHARAILKDHPINRARIAAGKDPANSIWMWSPGRRPAMETLEARFGVKGAVISAVDLIMGLGVYAGMDVIRVPGATGLEDTNYEGKAEAGLDALKDHDFVYVHVEATDEAGHARDLDLKIRCIEYLDDRLVRPILEGLQRRGVEATVAVLPDHPTPVETGAHANDPVPVAIRRPGEEPDGVEAYDEARGAEGSLGVLEGDDFMRRVVG